MGQETVYEGRYLSCDNLKPRTGPDDLGHGNRCLHGHGQRSGTQSIPLYALPDAASDVIRNVPVGDLMLYPQQELAPQQSEDWIWVRHDISQEDIWQGGEFGWVRPDNLTICG